MRNRLRTVALLLIAVLATFALSGCFSKATPKDKAELLVKGGEWAVIADDFSKAAPKDKVHPQKVENPQPAPIGKIETVTLEVTGVT